MIEGVKLEIKSQKEIENINKRIKENDNEIINNIKIKDEESNIIGIKSYNSYEKRNKLNEHKMKYPKQIEKKKKKCHEMRFNKQNIIEEENLKEEYIKNYVKISSKRKRTKIEILKEVKENEIKRMIIKNILNLEHDNEFIKEKVVKNKKQKLRKINLFINNIIIQILIICLFVQMFSSNKLYSILSYLSKITLKIKGKGYKNVYSSSNQFRNENHPQEIKINGDKQINIIHSYNLTEENNFIELIWNDAISICQHLFDGCSDIIFIDLSDFDSSQVITTFSMFRGCSSLISLNLSNFDTSKVYQMGNMFEGCSSLISLDLSHFITSEVEYMQQMFSGCTNLQYINLKNFDQSKLSTCSNMFDNITDNVVICINKDINGKIISKLPYCYTINCSDYWKSNQKKLIYKTGECVNNCNDTYKYEFNGKCYKNCEYGYTNDNICKCKLDQCLSCPLINLNLCTECNDKYYKMENDPLNIGGYFNCYKEIKGYYLDNSLFKKCYDTCETCKIKGNYTNHNCLECNSNFTFEISMNNYKNCYTKCNYYYYFDNETNFHCTSNYSCPKEYPYLLPKKNECISENINPLSSLWAGATAQKYSNVFLETPSRASSKG